MTRRLCEAGKLLQWLSEVLKRAEAVDVELVVVDTPDARSSVQITLHDVPGPLAGLEVGPPSDD
jgi:Mrp family chromosome partitioning ATPase